MVLSTPWEGVFFFLLSVSRLKRERDGGETVMGGGGYYLEEGQDLEGRIPRRQNL